MDTKELACIVQEMRHAQNEYFRTRSNTALKEAKNLEAQVDRCCQEIIIGQQRLFPDF